MGEEDHNSIPVLRVAMLLPGLGRVQRGAETAFLALAAHLNAYPDVRITLFGSGSESPPGVPIINVGCTPRERFERWPKLPLLRSEYAYEELTFVMRLLASRAFNPRDFDIALHCSFPFTNWFLQRAGRRQGPKSVFVTQNGDWMCRAESAEYRTFKCDALVCTNPEYYDRHQNRYKAALIPNGVDPDQFHPDSKSSTGPRDPRFPIGAKIVLMVSALIPSKRVLDGIKAVALLPEAFLVIAGDGPDRQLVTELAARELPGRHLLLGSLQREMMPDVYRKADVFLHMSQDEPFGIIYLEAAASGVPVVAHDAAVPRWILGSSAKYANTSDPSAVAAALRDMFSSANLNLGGEARNRVLEGWTWASLAEKYRQFFYSVIPNQRVPEVPCSP